jgi:hypothetical protein
MNPERIEQARRFGGELCDIDGCPELGTLEHVRNHLRKADAAMSLETATTEAARLGADAGKAAASWYEIGADNAAAILRGIEDGDPAVLDTFPSAPISGEWAGDPLPRDIILEVGADVGQLTPEDEDDILRAYEDAYYEAAADEIERRARYHSEAIR